MDLHAAAMIHSNIVNGRRWAKASTKSSQVLSQKFLLRIEIWNNLATSSCLWCREKNCEVCRQTIAIHKSLQSSGVLKQNFQNCAKLCKMCKNVQKCANVQNCAKFAKLCKMCKIVQNVQNVQKCAKMCKCAKLLKMCKVVQNVQNCAKCEKLCKMCKIVQYVQKCAKCAKLCKMCKVVQNVQNCAKFAK